MAERRIVIDEKLIEHLSWLSRIRLEKEEIRNILPQLTRILEFFHQMDEAGVENTPPLFTVVEYTETTRADEPSAGLSQEEALRNAPEREGAFIKAPRIL